MIRIFSGAGFFCGDTLWEMLIQPVQEPAMIVAEDLKHAAQSVGEKASNAAKEVADDLSRSSQALFAFYAGWVDTSYGCCFFARSRRQPSPQKAFNY